MNNNTSSALLQNLKSTSMRFINESLAINSIIFSWLPKKMTVTSATMAGVSVYLSIYILYRAFLGPLSYIPGPFILKFVSRLFVLHTASGTGWKQLQEWQSRYGRVIRIGPTSILVSDKQMLKQILQKEDLPKSYSYQFLQILTGNTLFFTVDKAFHKQQRRIIAPAFSMTHLHQSVEPCMISANETLIRRINDEIISTNNDDEMPVYRQVDIWCLLHDLGLDVVGQTLFGQKFGTLESKVDVVSHTASRNFEALNTIADSPISGMLKSYINFSEIAKANKAMKMLMIEIIMERLRGGEITRREDVLQMLIDSQKSNKNEDHRSIADAIAAEAVILLHAGSESTSNITGFALIELLKNPEILARLREEIDTIKLEQQNQTLPHYSQLKHLPYLNAVINEALRLNFINANGIEREADKDMILGDFLFVPKGTTIRCNMYHLHRDPEYWPEPEKFKPERWLDESDIPADMDAFHPFSIGSRTCIGKTFALQMMRITLTNLVKNYDFKVIPSEMKASDDRRSFITLSVKNGSFKVQMKRR